MSLNSFAQTKDSTATALKEIVLTKVKKRTSGSVEPQEIRIISKSQIENSNSQTTADLLLSSGELHVQKSQQGGGSPVIRGFEASRILLVVDGVRMNNLIYRSGHLQNSITIDQNSLEKLSLFYGPTATIYGSDALGGALHFETRKTAFSIEKKELNGNFTSRLSSVNSEKTGSIFLNYSSKKWAHLTTFSYSKFGDLRMGKRKNRHADFFGVRDFYVNTINGEDAVIENNKAHIQVKSGYTQHSFLHKTAYLSKNNTKHEINLQYSTTSNIPRYDRLTEISDNKPKFAEWFYGPQNRLLAVYSVEKKRKKADLGINISYQNIKESRHTRKYNDPVLENRNENVNVFALNVDGSKFIKKARWFFGFDSYFETLNSYAYSNNIINQEIGEVNSRYPNGKNHMWRNEVYSSIEAKFNEKTFMNIGGRIGHTTLSSSFDSNTIFQFPFNSIKQNNLTYSGSLGVVHKIKPNINLKGNISSGFRVPNIDDLAKIFDSGNGFLVVPNQNIKPEKTITTDLALHLGNKKNTFYIENTFYYTRFIDAILLDNFKYNNSETYTNNGETSIVLANQNKGKAFVTGLNTRLYLKVSSAFDASFNYNYTLGRFIENNRKTPLDHIPPVHGKLGITYKSNLWNTEAYLIFNGKKPIEDYFLNGEDNEKYAPEDGMPAWETYNLKGTYKGIKKVSLFMGVENILDTQYRVFASGINAPGRNLYLGAKYNFLRRKRKEERLLR